MTITRFVPNPANDTSHNTTLTATMALSSQTPASGEYFAESLSASGVNNQVWVDLVHNTSTVAMNWQGGDACFTAQRFLGQLSTVRDLKLYNEFVGFATYNGTVAWRGHARVNKYMLHSLVLYTDASPGGGNAAVGFWDNNGNVYEFHKWSPGASAPAPPAHSTGTCHRVQATEEPQRPSWWQQAAERAGVLAQDGGVAVLHGKDVWWMFGDSFLRKASPACSWPGVSNTAMRVQQPAAAGDPVQAEYYTASPSDNAGCAWFFCPVSKTNWGAPHNRRIWPSAGTTVQRSSAAGGGDLGLVYVTVVDALEPGYALGVSNATAGAPPAYQLVGHTPQGGYTQFPVQQPGLMAFKPDEDGYLYMVDFAIPVGQTPLGRYSRLLRVHKDEATLPSAYQFWTGAYSSLGSSPAPEFAPQSELSPMASPPFLVNVNNPQVDVSYNPGLGLYVMSTAETSQQLYLRFSPWPTGPWSAHVPLYSHAHAADRSNVYIYCAYQHPELQPKQATNASNMTLTFSRNGGGCGFASPCNDWMLHVAFV